MNTTPVVPDDMSDLPAEVQEIIRNDIADAHQSEWRKIGIAAMDSATLLLSDPCYSYPYGQDSAEKDFEITDCKAVYASMGEGHFGQLTFKKGHTGAGVVIHSPHGDGAVVVWAKTDIRGRVRAVFFSFDGELPSHSSFLKVNAT